MAQPLQISLPMETMERLKSDLSLSGGLKFLLLATLLSLGGQLWAESGQNRGLLDGDFGVNLPQAIPDPGNPLVQLMLKDRPLIVGEENPFDRTQFDGPGYFSLEPSDKSHWKKSGGWTSSGGGGTVLCYGDEETLANAVEEIETVGLLSDESIDAATRVVTHEYAERWRDGVVLESEMAFFEAVQKALTENNGQLTNADIEESKQAFLKKSWQEIVQLIDDKVYAHSPVFWDRLWLLRRTMPRKNWIPAKLTPVKDFEIKPPVSNQHPAARELGKSCLHWPAVIRKFDFRPGVEKPITLYFEPRIWERLGPLNRALLVYHEEIYAMMQFLGIHTADRPRSVVRRFFSWRYWLNLQNKYSDQAIRARAFQADLGPDFGDYYKFFANQVNPVAALGPRATPASWYTSYFLATNNFNDLLKSCLEQAERSSEPNKWDICEGTAMNQMFDQISDQRDGEMAFILMVRFELDFVPGLISGSEWFLLSNHSDETWMTPTHLLEMAKACGYLQSPTMESSKYYQSHPKIIQSARSYCQKHAQ